MGYFYSGTAVNISNKSGPSPIFKIQVLLVEMFFFSLPLPRRFLWSSIGWLVAFWTSTFSLDPRRTKWLNSMVLWLVYRPGYPSGVLDSIFAGTSSNASSSCTTALKVNYNRWGYGDLAETREQVTNMRQANIPLEGWLRPYHYGYAYSFLIFPSLHLQSCGMILIFTMLSVTSPLILLVFREMKWKHSLRSLWVTFTTRYFEKD